MTKDEFHGLTTGDIVRSVGGTNAYVVYANYGNRVTAVRTVDVTDPDEWILARKAGSGDTKDKGEETTDERR